MHIYSGGLLCGSIDGYVFTTYVYASTSWAHLKINELNFLIYTGYIVKNV